ncbi:YadA-like family protein [Acinetobacter sp. TUM15071]|uniref:YadA-like family protein n=1 Tax=Acinetobacter sp. TUM15071 TaxID=2609135 RepID=UPI001D1922F6|nr:YadA-like family protein [Acinetobacter sp. TUM15071]
MGLRRVVLVRTLQLGSDGTTANSASADGGAVAIGRGQRARGDGAVAIGDPNTTNGNGAVAVGRNNTAAGDTAGNTAADGAVALGNENQAIGQGSVALGNASRAEQAGSIALGDTANAKAARGIALGSNAVANNADDVALGSGSTTSTASGAGFLTGTAAPTSVVSVGTAGNERRIQNLSDGAADTDAVNVRQLKSLKDIVDEQGDTTAASLGGGSTYDPDTGTVTNPTYNVNGKDVNNVGAAITELDKGWNLQSNGANTGAVKAGDTVDIGTADGEENLQVAKDGNNIKYSLNRDLKVDSVKAGDTVINNDGMTIANGPSVTKSGIDAAGNTISNVADGVAGSDAVNKNQLDNAAAAAKTEVTEGKNITVTKTTGDDGQDIYNVATADDVEFNSIKAGDTVINNDGMTIAGGPSVTKDGIDAGNKTIGNVADGVADSDAVNKGQLDKSSQDLTDKGFGLTAQDGTTVQKKLGEAVEVVGADSNITTKVQDGKVAIELAKDLDVNSVKAGDTVINNDGMSIANGPSVTKSGIDAAGNTISNVGPGVAGTDAVNKDQLDNAAAAAKTEVTEGKNITVTKTTGDDGQDIYNVATADDVEFNSVKAGDTVINNDGMTIAGGPSVTKDGIDAGNKTIGNVADGVADSDAVNKGQLDKSSQDLTDKGFGLTAQDGSTVQKKLGEAVEVVGADSNITTKVEDGKVAIELAKDLDVNSVKAGDTVINNDGMSIANGPSVTKSGIDAARNTISNVGPGVAGTDAVNKDQLDNAAAAAKTEVTEGKNITVTKTTGDDGQDIYNVATADDVEFNNVKVGDVTIDGTTGKISGVAAGDVNPDSTDAINGSQLANNAQSVADALGGGSTVNPDGTVSQPNYSVNGNEINNVGDAITELDKGWTLQSNGANAAAVKAGDTVDIGTADGEENLQVAKEGNDIKYSLKRDLKVDSVTAGDTVINNDGMTITGGPSVTKSGIDAAGNTISNVGPGVAGTDAVNKDQLDNAAAAAKTEVTEGKNITVTKTTGDDGQDIYNVATADDVEFNNVKVGDVTIDGTTGKISGVAAGDVNPDSTDAINGSQLANNAQSVADALGGGSTVNPDGTVSQPNYSVNGNEINNVGDAITELDKGWTLQSNDANAAAVKAGDTVDIGTADGEENLQVAKEGNDIKYSLNRDLKVDSVTAGDTVINNDGMSIANGPSVTKSGIDAAGNTISNVGPGVAGTDAVNKDQLDNAAAAAKTEVTEGKNITVTKTTGDDGQDIYNVATADDVEFNNVKVGDVTIDGTTGKISGVAAGDVNPDSTDAINGSQLANNAQSVADALGGGSTVNPDGTVSQPNYSVNGNEINNVGDAITELDKGWTLQSNGANAAAVKAGDTVDIGTADGEENLQVAKEGNDIKYSLNRDLKVDSVTAGDTVINNDGMSIANGPSVTKSGIDAGGQKLTNVAPGTVSADSTEGINGSQLHAQGEGVKNIIGGNTTYDPATGQYTNPDIGGTGENNINDAIGSLGRTAAAAKTEVEAGKNMTVESETGADGQTIYTVATADDVEFDSVKVGDVTIDGTTGKISGVAAGDVNPDSTDAINGSQLANNAQSVADALGGGSTVNPDGTVSQPNYSVNGNEINNVGDAITELDKGWTLQSNGANAAAVKAGDTVDIGTAEGEENLQVAKEGNDIKYSLNRDLKVDSVTAGDTVINNDGMSIANGPSVTKSGIDVAGNKISNVAAGTEGTDAVNKDQLDSAAAAAKTEVEAGKNMTVESETGADGQTIYTVATADDVEFDSVKVGDVNIDGSTGKISGVSAGDVAADSTDAINGSQLHGVADSVKNAIGGETTLNPDGSVTTSNVGNTGQNNIHDAIDSVRGQAAAAKTEVTEGKNITVTKTTGDDGQDIYNVATADDVEFDSVKVGDVTIDGTTGKISGVAAGDVNPDSTDAINGSQLANNAQSVADALGGGSTVNPDGTVSQPNYSVNGNEINNVGDAITELDKGWTLQSNGANAAAVKAGDTVDIGTADGEENLQVAKEGNDIKYSLNRDLKVDSVTAGNTRLDNSGVEVKDAVGNSTRMVAGGTIVKDAQGNSTATTAAGTTIKDVQGNSTILNGTGLAFTDASGAPVGPSVSRTGIDAGGEKITNVADGEVAAGSKDAVNGGQLNDSVDTVGDIIGGGVTNEGGKLNGPFTVNDKGYANIADAIAAESAAAKTEVEAGKNMTVESETGADGQTIYTVATADDVEFDTVKVGDVSIDGSTGKISGVSAGDVAADSTDAINGSQLHGVADSVKNAIGGETTLNPDGTVTTSNVGNTGKNNIHDAIDSVRGQAVAAKTEVEAGKNMTVESETGAHGQTIYTVATADDVEFNNVKVGDVSIDGTTGKISGVAAGDVNPNSTDAINGSQLANNAQSVADALGGGSTVNPDGTVSKPNYTVNGDSINNVGDAITALDKGWTLQSNGENAAAVKAGDTVDIGTADGEENLQVTKEGNDIKYSLNRDLKVDSVTAGDTVINNDGLSITNGPSVTRDGINAGGKKLTNVAAGTVSADSTDAINGSQLHAQGEGVKNIIGGNTTYDPATGQYTNPDIGGTGQDNINDAIGAVGDAAKAAKTTVKEGENIVVTESKNADGSTNYEVATAKDVKFDSVTATDDEGNETVLTATGTQVKDGEGNEAEYGAKGISLKDQEGKGTLINQDGLSFIDTSGANIGPSITAAGINAGNTVITGVAAGRVAADSQDAINGSQLHGVADSVKNIIGGNTTVNPDGTLSGSNIGGTGKDNVNDAIGAVGDAAKAAKSTVSNKDGNISVNETTKPDGSRDYEVGLAKDIKVDSVTAGGTKVDGDGLHIDGGPSVTRDGIDAGDKKVTGVADGEVAKDSKDAVNGGQLHDVADSVKNVVGGNTTVNPDGTISTSNVGGTGHNNINDAIASVKQDAQAAKSTVSNKDGNIKVNETTKADGSKDYEVGLAKDITVDSVTAKDVKANQVTVAGDQGTTNITGGGISITGPKGEAGPSMTTDGINAGGKKVTGVADGAIHSASKDAINGSQLHQSYQDVGAALGGGAGYDPEKGWKGPTYNVAGSNYNNVGDALGALNQADQALDNRITNLGDQMQQAFYDTNRRIDDVEKKANAGVAAAIALEAAPFVAGKYTYAVGAAYHGGENAFGATLRKTADNGRWSLTGGVAAASQGDPSFRLGLSGVID